MKTLYCPRCHAANTDAEAQAGQVRCTSCEQWFSEKGFNPWGNSVQAAGTKKSGNVGLVIWPVVLLAVVLAGVLGIIPLLWTGLLALFAILGSVITFLAQKR